MSATDPSPGDGPAQVGFLAAPIPAALLSSVGLIVATNVAFEAMVAKTATSSSSILGLAHPADRSKLATTLDGVARNPTGAVRVRFGTEESFVEGEVYAACADGLVCLQVVEVASRQDQFRPREHSAHYDHLTGVLDRRGLIAEAERLLARGARDRHHVSLLSVDVVGLEPVNDQSGRPAADRLLHRIAGLLVAAFRDGDVIGRVGGDEFAVVALSTGEASAIALHHQFVELVTARNETVAVHENVEIALGVVTRPAWETPTIASLLDAPDRLVYRLGAQQIPAV